VALRVTVIVEGAWLAEAAVGSGVVQPPHALIDTAVAAAVARALP
jgi:hypothetical protein